MSNLYMKALEVAQSFDVSTPKDSLVLYSISYLPSKKNRDDAFAYIVKTPQAVMIEHTTCGAKLVEMGLWSTGGELLADEVADIWKTASRRLINSASGNITAFVEGADERSGFISVELPTILKNEAIPTINGEDKFLFAKKI